jgi:phytoene dehydrogenase-like protein
LADGIAENHDAIIVGSGINGLACAALLAKGGWNVCVLERNDWFGGAIKTAEITEPGFQHDVFSAWHPLWVGGPAHAQLGDDLARHGLEYLNTELPTGTLYPDGESAFLLRTADANAAELDRHHAGDGDAWRALLGEFFPNADLAFGVLGTELWGRGGAGLALKAVRRLGRAGAAEFTGKLLISARDWLETAFASERTHGLLAPWVLHTGLGPDAAASGYMAQVIAVAVQEGGMPIPRGGGAKLADALVAYIREQGGTCETGAHVERVSSGGVRTADGRRLLAERAVICNVTPTQLYGDLLDGFEQKAKQFRYGRSEMQIHFALSEPPRWEGDERLGQTAIVHLTPGLNGVSRAVNEAERGLLPAEATVVVGQPLTIDPSRAPEGKGLLWIQLQELPWHVKGDAAGELEVGDGAWTEALRERYADRIQARIAEHIPNLESSILGRTVLSPADLQSANVNLHHGDPYGGSLALDQNFLWRPLASQPGHKTPVENVWHIGASTHPGPGLGGGSGALVAAELLEPSLPKRLVARFTR